MSKATKTTIEFSAEANEALETLAAILETTKAEALRSALSLYQYVVANVRNTSKSLAIVSEDREPKVEKIIAVPGIVPAESASAYAERILKGFAAYREKLAKEKAQ